MTDKTVAQFLGAVGPPSSRSLVGKNVLLQWHATGYHIAILFDVATEQFVKITHEFGSYEPAPNYAIGIVVVIVIVGLGILLSIAR